MLGELRLALRRLLRQPTYTFVTVSILALGLGVTTAMFSVMNEAMLRPLPYPRPDSLVQLRVEVGPPEARYRFFPPFVFRHLRENNQVLEGIAAVAHSGKGLGYPGQPAELEVSLLNVSADFFPMLGVQAALGRVPSADEHQEGRNQVVVLSDRLWRQQFGGDPAVLGKSVELGRETVTVIGVMPPHFTDPMRRSTRADLWRPLGLTAASMDPQNTDSLTVWARIKPGVSRKAAEAHLTGLLGNLGDGEARRASTSSLGNDSALEAESLLGIRFTTALSVFVLLIAGVNLAGLQLARLAARSHEQAIRVALGASRLRLMRQTFAESLLLSMMGGALGLVLSSWCTTLFTSRLVLTNGPRAVGFSTTIDWRVWTFAGISVLVTALIAGTAPAWLRGREQLAQTLGKGARGTIARGRPRLRRSLAVAQMGMALLLLMGGGLFVRGLERMAASNPGWQVDGLLIGGVTLKGDRYNGSAARVAYVENLQRRLAALPGVTGAALADSLPYMRPERVREFKVEGLPARPGGREAETVAVSDDYFSALGMAVREGRVFGRQDVLDGLPVTVVNEAMARDLWPGASPIGKRLSFAWNDPTASARYKAWKVVVGVVANVGHPGDVEPATPYQAYFPFAQLPDRGIHLAVRAEGPPEALTEVVRQAVAQVDPDRQLKRTAIARSVIKKELSNFRVFAWAVVALAGVGVLLAALGVYGLFSGFVTEQTRELGVRMALGATRRQVVWMVLRKGMLLAGVGALVGVAGGMGVVEPVLGSVVFGLPPHEPLLVLLLALLLTAVALFACWIPARRASRIDPLAAIRED